MQEVALPTQNTMPGLLIIAHAPLASSLKQVAQHAFPDCASQLQALDVTSEMTPEDIESCARSLLARLRVPEALILTDVFGATPCNVSVRLAGQFNSVGNMRVKVISGVNVPMLWRAINHAGDAFDQLVDCASAGATDGVKVLSSTRAQNQPRMSAAHDPHTHQDQQ
jgi:mannose PTS system EIIA component